jgi:hypothetical protein
MGESDANAEIGKCHEGDTAGREKVRGAET